MPLGPGRALGQVRTATPPTVGIEKLVLCRRPGSFTLIGPYKYVGTSRQQRGNRSSTRTVPAVANGVLSVAHCDSYYYYSLNSRTHTAQHSPQHTHFARHDTHVVGFTTFSLATGGGVCPLS